jgi:uncharacterized protein (DUF427 family)
MGSLKNDAIGSFNNFLSEQQKLEGECQFTLVLFDGNYYKPYDGINIQEIKPLNETTYCPAGSTAYFDALGKTIDSVGTRLNNTPEELRPEKIVVAIFTDGEENSSCEYSGDKIREMVEHQESKYNWQFIFMAANQDAFKSAQHIGIHNYSNVRASGQSIFTMNNRLNDVVSCYRSSDIDSKCSIDLMPQNIDD